MAEGGSDFGYEDPELDNLLDNDDDETNKRSIESSHSSQVQRLPLPQWRTT